MSRSGIVNVRMVITEEKILSNIEKVQKMINPNSKKQIVQLEEDAYFKDLIEAIKTYLIEYPKKKNFPSSVYKAAYGLVEFATNQFEENTKRIEELIRQREQNIALAGELKELLGLKDLRRIESFDNSHLFGTFYVGGMVVFDDFLPNKDLYRKYKISTDVKDDLGAMKEGIYRRYFKVLMEESYTPDLIVMDGGQLQISACKEVLDSLNLHIPIIGLVKDDKQII